MGTLETRISDRLAALPESTLELAAATDRAALELIEAERWPTGPSCPNCAGEGVSRMTGARSIGRNLWRCADCGGQFSWRKGTEFSASVNTPRQIAFVALGRARGQEATVTVRELQLEFGFGTGRAIKLAELLSPAHALDPLPEVAQDPYCPPPRLDVALPAQAAAEPETTATPLVVELNEAGAPASASGGKARWWGHRVARAAVSAAALLAVLGTLAFRGGPTAEAEAERKHVCWVHAGVPVELTGSRLTSEDQYEWRDRFLCKLKAAQDEFPPD